MQHCIKLVQYSLRHKIFMLLMQETY